MKLLITVANIKEFRPMAEGIDQERINPYIQEAQQIDLKRLLGDALFYDFLLRFDVQADPIYTDYQKLLRGSVYTYGPQTLQNPGLIPYMVYKALARFYANNPMNITRFGITLKRTENSDQVDPRTMAAAIAELNSNALAIQTDVWKFLRTMGAIYPLFNYADGSALGQEGVKFFDPDDRRPKSTDRTLISW